MLQVILVAPIVCWWKEHSILEESTVEGPICHETKNSRDERGKDSPFVVVDQDYTEILVSEMKERQREEMKLYSASFESLNTVENHQLQLTIS